MPDTPFSAIEPWNVPTGDPHTTEADETARRIAEELRRLRTELHETRRPRSKRRPRPKPHR